MTLSQVSSFLFVWGLIGCLLFFSLVVVLFRTGIVYTARKPDGTLKLVPGLLIGALLALVGTAASYFLWMH